MKNLLLPVVLILIMFVTFQCCTSKTKRSRKPVSTVSLSPAQKNYQIGQSVTISVSTRIHDGELKYAKLFLNDSLLITSTSLSFNFSLDSLVFLGQNTIRVVAEKTDNTSNVRIHTLNVLSDILPVKYQYEIVAEYPHSKEHFTQGLEFYKGFLYEGTGEHGKSAVYKTDHTTSRILQSKNLPDRYFGEGITIHDNKLYQLTYKTQTGFVYSLSDFAVIDSFRFDSKEGWGLTNDGKYLIMSNGTSSLLWLDPDNYKVVKRVEVADHQRIWQYLNELEYVDGYIWANVWTTNQIIKIEASTGKITGYVDLEGILSIMHTTQNERIDVLNGIAYNPKSGNLFITGKLWPKIFEIRIKES
jgi:glutaminyl-peptide cyclotransferase